jgi:arylsulfatase A-like enzyme
MPYYSCPKTPGRHALSTDRPSRLSPRILFVAIGLLLAAAPPIKALDDRPNIIYIMTDDLGYGDLGCYGQKRIKTPNIDRLAREGLRFTDHYAGHTVCRPSRLVLWTGRHSGHTAIHRNAAYHFQPADVTVMELLQKAGYVTGGVGKWALGNTENSGHPNLNGFDFWMGYLDQGAAHNYYPTHLWRNREQVPLTGNVLSKHPTARGRVADKRVTYSHDVMTDEALAFVRRSHKVPFLLHVHWTIPHANNEGGRVKGDGMEVPDYGIYRDEKWPDVEKGQAAMITRMDRDVGRLLALLGELKIDERAILFFTSDNGPHSEGGHKHPYFDANGPLRGFKRDLYDGGIRVPLIVRWPKRIRPGAVSALPSAFWDYLPTACELAGVKPPKAIDGISYLPTLLGRDDEQKTHDYLFWRSGDGRSGKIAVRAGTWKGVRVGKKPLELYDLTTDIGEANDIAAKHPEIVARLEGMIKDAVRPLP